MTTSDFTGASDQRLASVRAALRNYLRRRYRLLANEHDDLLQQTLSDLFEATRESGSRLDDARLHAFAYAILKRRIVDRFRREARSVISYVEPGALPERHDEGSFDAHMHYRRLLRAVLLLVDELNPEQQALLLDETLPGSSGDARSPAQRQQLRRLRELLRTRLLSEYGIRIDDAALE